MQNGMLPIAIPQEQCRELAQDAEAGFELEVDLEKEEIRRMNGNAAIPFAIDPFRRHCLLHGLDDIGLTMQREDVIRSFETRRSQTWPWLDGHGYNGKIPVEPVRAAKKTDW